MPSHAKLYFLLILFYTKGKSPVNPLFCVIVQYTLIVRFILPQILLPFLPQLLKPYSHTVEWLMK